MQYPLNRRDFVAAATAAGVSLAVHGAARRRPPTSRRSLAEGETRTQSFPAWPVMDSREEKSMLATLRSGKWYRGNGANVEKFEQSFARLTGAKHCVATNGGTTALIAALGALEIGPGDEVIVTPYTFIATINSILMHYALPVLVDIDPETYQIDPAKIEAAITDRTAAILPVHIGGNVADMDSIMAVAGGTNCR